MVEAANIDRRAGVFPQGRVETIDFRSGVIDGWIEMRGELVPHLQVREGGISLSSGFTLGRLRSDVAESTGLTASAFRISAGRPLSPWDVQQGTTAVHILWGLEDRLLEPVARVRRQLKELVDALPEDKKPLRGNFAHIGAPIGTRVVQGATRMSSFDIPVGATSGDGVVVVGDEGHLFLKGGGNALEVQYSWGTSTGPSEGGNLIENRAQGWLEVLNDRAKFLETLGVPFRQVVLPEKNTVLPDLLPLNVETPTPLCRRLLEDVRQKEWFVDCFTLFREWDTIPGPPWMKVDSHFTTYGAFATAGKILTSLGLCSEELFEEVRIGPAFEYLAGNMGWRIAGFDLYDRLEIPDESTLRRFGPSVDPILEHTPVSGGNIGTTLEWENDLAPIHAHVLVFGSSSFGRGRKANQLSWWFSRLFKRFTMVWSPDVDFQLVERSRPDAVVCQTVERFLMKVPLA